MSETRLEPRINDLKAENGLGLDTITIMSNPEKLAAKIVAIDEKQRRRGVKPLAFLSVAEVKSLMAVILKPRDRAIFSVAYHRGLRASEVGMLQMRDYTPPNINARTGSLYCRRLKDSDSKIYSLTRPEQRELRACLRLRGDKEGPIFTSHH
jgi:integrase